LPFRFSKRWQDQELSPNPLSLAIAERKRSGLPIFDLTLSNPTLCGLDYPEDWTRLLDQPGVRSYQPNPQGLAEARQAITEYYAIRRIAVEPSDFFLTSGTSEAYSHLFKLLCDPGDTILVPRPSYPLLETLAGLEHLHIETYPLMSGTWNLDRTAIESVVNERTRALVMVQPNNPTGSILSQEDVRYLLDFAEKHGLALIVDEVFADFIHENLDTPFMNSMGPLVFTLNGLSKLLGLPQLKLAWIHVSGNPALKSQAKSHLEWISDAYLSVGIAPQIACVDLLRRHSEFQTPIRNRLKANLQTLREMAAIHPELQPLWPQGGWCIPVRCRGVKDDEAMAVRLVRDRGVIVQPGYFFDFEEEDVVVLSLLTDPTVFREGVNCLLPLGK